MRTSVRFLAISALQLFSFSALSVLAQDQTVNGSLSVSRTASDGATLLNINGGASSTGYRIVAQNNGTNVFRIAPSGNLLVDVLSGSDGAFVVNNAGSGPAALFNGGNVGIGLGATLPGNRLHVNGGISAGDSKFWNSVQLTDSNNGNTQSWIWASAANQLDFGVGAVGYQNRKMTLDASGNVGIGTTNPTQKLEVAGNAYVQGTLITSVLTTRSGATSYYGQGEVPGNSLSENDLDLSRPNLGSNSVLRFNHHTGISLSAHSSYGGIRFYNQGYSNSNSNPYDSTIGASLVMALTNGSVGIGTTGPTEKLHLLGGGLLLDANPSLSFNAELGSAIRVATTGGWARGYGVVDANNEAKVVFGALGGANSLAYAYIGTTYSSPWLAITQSGNVGIGTTTPSASMLQVSANANSAGAPNRPRLQLTDTATGGGDWLVQPWYAAGGDGNFAVLRNGGNGNLLLAPNGNGNVGIGTTAPSAKLEIGGAGAIAYLNGSDNVATLSFGRSDYSWRIANETDLRIYGGGGRTASPNDNLAFAIKNGTGNVGIGTASPAAKLDVAGDLNVRGKLTLSSNNSLTALGVDSSGYTFAERGLGISNLNTYGSTTYADVFNVLVGDTSTFSGANAAALLIKNVGDRGTRGNPNGSDLIRADFRDGPGFILDRNGNVGVGTDTPVAKFHVVGPYPQLALDNPTAGAGDEIRLMDGGVLRQKIGHITTTHSLQFGTGGTDANGTGLAVQFTIDELGRVGIGTAAPASNLHIKAASSSSQLIVDAPDANNTWITFASSQSYKWMIGSNGHTAGNLFTIGKATAADTSTPYLAINHSSGNVGIGTTNPGAKLEVVGGGVHITGFNNPTQGGAGLELGFDGIETAIQSYNRNTSTYLPAFYNASAHIFNNGNVGIGTTTPSAKLDVAGNTNISGNLTVSGTFSAPSYTASNGVVTGGASGLTLNAGGSNQNVAISPSGTGAIVLNGNVGVGTSTPSGKLTVTRNDGALGTTGAPGLWLENVGTGDSGITFKRAGQLTGGEWQVFQSNDANKFKIGRAAVADYVTIDTTGNVGIGTTNPGAYKLAVNGTIHAKEVIVDQLGWADNVFDASYRNAPLSEVEEHIKEHGHLPGVPSAQEVAEKGVNVGQIEAVLLRKIEELTLHQIAQEKALREQRSMLETQGDRIKRLEAENAALRGHVTQ